MTTATAERPKTKKDTKKKAPKQPELDGMPENSEAGKLALEYLEGINEIKGIEEGLTTVSENLIAAMKRNKQQVMKVMDPATNKHREFKVTPGHDKLSVRTVKDKFGGGAD